MPFTCMTRIEQSLKNFHQRSLFRQCEGGRKWFHSGKLTSLSRTHTKNPSCVRVVILYFVLLTMCAFSYNTSQCSTRACQGGRCKFRTRGHLSPFDNAHGLPYNRTQPRGTTVHPASSLSRTVPKIRILDDIFS